MAKQPGAGRPVPGSSASASSRWPPGLLPPRPRGRGRVARLRRGRPRRSERSPFDGKRRLHKCPTGIVGLDEITEGGLPRGRPTLLCGGAGCGKTLMATEFLVRGAMDHAEPGVMMLFEETLPELEANVASLGFDLRELIRRRKLVIDHVRVERSEIEETGEYDLEALFVRLNHAIDSIGARRVVLDTVEGLFAALPNEMILRAELRRLFRWLKNKGVTAIITGERGREQLTRRGLEEYVSDCVILLDHRIHDRIATRHLRVVKYRGSLHGTNEYPFLIGDEGISVLPITSLGLHHTASRARVSTGIAELDAMLGNRGLYRCSSILVTGSPGSGKTSIAACFVHAAARRGERAMFFAFEESASQILRDTRAIGIDLAPHVRKGLLDFHAVRPTLYGLEMHLATMFKEIAEFAPSVVVIDPMNSLLAAGTESETRAMMIRLIDFLKSQEITSLFTSLTPEGSMIHQVETLMSSLMDTWLSLHTFELDRERTRGLTVVKSRGMAHSNRVREFEITSRGLRILEPFEGPMGILVGSTRKAQALSDAALRSPDGRRSTARDRGVRERELAARGTGRVDPALDGPTSVLPEVDGLEESGRFGLSIDPHAFVRSRPPESHDGGRRRARRRG